ncbi:MAG: hypothetical protein VB021_05440 [Oscillospiraceae bacterium]|nr:hypothetical protein [Oscillospiraceae bacterium]
MAQIKGTALPTVSSAGELAALVGDVGFLPAFRNRIHGFSAEECVAPAYWFSGEGEGFWEWKGPVIRRSGCAYGKLLGGRAAFVAPEWYAELANVRRDGYDFDARWDDGLARREDKQVYDALCAHGSLLSKQLHRTAAPGEKRAAFDGVMTRLQMLGYVVVADFEYETDRRGQTYGWGVARYETPEHRFGAAFTDAVYAHAPQESRDILLGRLGRLLPETPRGELLRLIG